MSLWRSDQILSTKTKWLVVPSIYVYVCRLCVGCSATKTFVVQTSRLETFVSNCILESNSTSSNSSISMGSNSPTSGKPSASSSVVPLQRRLATWVVGSMKHMDAVGTAFPTECPTFDKRVCFILPIKGASQQIFEKSSRPLGLVRIFQGSNCFGHICHYDGTCGRKASVTRQLEDIETRTLKPIGGHCKYLQVVQNFCELGGAIHESVQPIAFFTKND